MVSIRIQHLSKSFGRVEALREVTLSIEPGERFFLLGPSGCGKTTLLRCLSGFHQPDSGRVLVGDEDVTGLPPERRRMGMVFQTPALWPHKTVAGNVAFGLEEAGASRAQIRLRVASALNAVGMAREADRRPAELSGGQQQRVALARALVVRPRCLLLDEPLSNLDARARTELSREICRVSREFRVTTIQVTHDRAEALATAERMAMIDRGRILQVGTPAGLHRRPRCRAVAEFIGDMQFLSGRVIEVSDDRATVQTPAGIFAGRMAEGGLASRGTVVTMATHPGSWRLGPGEGSGMNSLRGRIEGSTFFGETTRHTVITPGGERIHLSELNGGASSHPRKGELAAWIAPEDVTLLIE